MSTKATESIVIGAPPAKVMAVLQDVSSLPTWSAVHKRAEVLEEDEAGRPMAVRMSVASAGITDVQVLRYSWEDSGVSWTLQSSTTQRSQLGAYRLLDANGQTRVEYRLEVDLKVPLPSLVVRQGLKGVVKAATKGLKQRVESA